MSTPTQSLPWPEGAPVVPVAAARGALDRLASLALRHPELIQLVPGLAQADGAIAADPPPCLEQLADELGGVDRGGLRDLDLLIEERSDTGPYTLMGPFTSFYPVHEEQEMAVVVAIGADGTAGAVYGIGDDLALQLAGRDVVDYLERCTGALESSLEGLEQAVRAQYGEDPADPEEARAEALAQLMDEHLYSDALGMTDPERRPAVELQDPAASGLEDLPEGTVAVADLRTAPLGARVDVLEAELAGDPLDHHLDWREGGLVVCIVRG